MGAPKIKTEEYIGKVYGLLTIISVDNHTGLNARKCLAKCVCGNYTKAILSNLKNSTTKSCGCYRINFSKTHGETNSLGASKEYNVWHHIKDRCYNSNDEAYKNYGARGIVMCDSWKNSFEIFLKDVGRAPSEKHTLDRYPNKDGNYESGNCRWVTHYEQNRNHRRNRWIQYKGKKMIAKDMAKELNIPYTSFIYYLNKNLTVKQILLIRKPKQ